MGVKDALAEKTESKGAVKLTKSMSIADMIKAMEPEIKKALPQVITPERFTRMALSALNTTPKLSECSQMSFLGALMNAAQLGLEPRLVHKPAVRDRGELILVYALWKAKNGGYGFEVMSKEDIDNHARRFSQSFGSSYSPWKTNYEEMAKKTVIKKCLKYAPLKSDFIMQLSNDESVKSEISVDMSEVANEQDQAIDGDYVEVPDEAADAGKSE